MPTYTWICSSCRKSLDTFSHSMINVEQPECCGTPMGRAITPSNFFMLGTSPSKDFKREAENDKLTQAARKAQALKDSGVVPREEVLRVEDVGKYEV